MPLIITATFFSRLGSGSRFWHIMRGRGFTLNLGVPTLHLRTTNIARGVLLIAMGVVLASGQLMVCSRGAVQMPWTQWILRLDDGIKQICIGREHDCEVGQRHTEGEHRPCVYDADTDSARLV
jgi:cytochrome c-type biogenesis protein